MEEDVVSNLNDHRAEAKVNGPVSDMLIKFSKKIKLKGCLMFSLKFLGLVEERFEEQPKRSNLYIASRHY